jgi:hypothetical protein
MCSLTDVFFTASLSKNLGRQGHKVRNLTSCRPRPQPKELEVTMVWGTLKKFAQQGIQACRDLITAVFAPAKRRARLPVTLPNETGKNCGETHRKKI